jgi:hypothetical protein
MVSSIHFTVYVAIIFHERVPLTLIATLQLLVLMEVLTVSIMHWLWLSTS